MQLNTMRIPGTGRIGIPPVNKRFSAVSTFAFLALTRIEKHLVLLTAGHLRSTFAKPVSEAKEDSSDGRLKRRTALVSVILQCRYMSPMSSRSAALAILGIALLKLQPHRHYQRCNLSHSQPESRPSKRCSPYTVGADAFSLVAAAPTSALLLSRRRSSVATLCIARHVVACFQENRPASHPSFLYPAALPGFI